MEQLTVFSITALRTNLLIFSCLFVFALIVIIAILNVFLKDGE
jgi:hypothetical protein